MISHVSDTPGAPEPGETSVTFCENDAGAQNTSLATGKVLPASDQTFGTENYYSLTYIMSATAAGGWTVSSIPQATYYPRAVLCKP